MMRKKLQQTREALPQIREAILAGRSGREIAAEFSMSINSVQRIAKLAGVSMKKIRAQAHAANIRERAEALIAEGLTIPQAAERLGYSKSYLVKCGARVARALGSRSPERRLSA